jgi:hypothetical protein
VLFPPVDVVHLAELLELHLAISVPSLVHAVGHRQHLTVYARNNCVKHNAMRARILPREIAVAAGDSCEIHRGMTYEC